MYRFNSDELISMCIYKITNTLTGKVYIGKTINTAKQRWLAHMSASRRPNSIVGRSKIARALAKYGETSFTFEVIDIAEDQKSLSNKEEFWISNLSTLAPNGYNLTAGGEGSPVSEELKNRMRKASRRLPSVTRVKVTRNDGIVFDSITQAAKETGCPLKSLDFCFKEGWRIVKGFQFKRGIHPAWDLEIKEKINGRIRFTFLLRSDGKKYKQLNDAARDLGVHRNSILNVLRGANKTCKGYSFIRVLL